MEALIALFFLGVTFWLIWMALDNKHRAARLEDEIKRRDKEGK